MPARILPVDKHLRRSRPDQLAQPVDAEVMNGAGSLELAEPDERHLHQAAFVAPVKVRVGLDAVDQNRAVRLIYVTIHEDSKRQIFAGAVRRLPLTSARARRLCPRRCHTASESRPARRLSPRHGFPSRARRMDARRVPSGSRLTSLTNSARLSIPRLPAAMAMRAPGRTTASSAVSCDRSAPRGSSRRARSNCCLILKS